MYKFKIDYIYIKGILSINSKNIWNKLLAILFNKSRLSTLDVKYAINTYSY